MQKGPLVRAAQQRRVAPQLARNPGIVRANYAGVFDLTQSGYEKSRAAILSWLKDNIAVRKFIAEPLGGAFDEKREHLIAQAVSSTNDDVTVVRLQHPEYDRESDSFDRVRDWRTDFTIARDADGAWLAVRQWFKGVATDVRKCYPPRVIRRLWCDGVLSDGLVLTESYWPIDYPEEIDTLVELIGETERTMPVVVLADGCPLDPIRVSRDSLGLAHVVKVPRGLRERLNATLEGGQQLEHGSLRTFYPRVGGQAPIAPAARWQTIIDWEYEGIVGPAAFAEWLHAELGRAVVARLLNDPAHRSFEELKGKQLQQQQAVAAENAVDVTSLRQSIALLQGERDLLLIDNANIEAQLRELSLRTEDLGNQISITDTRYNDERTRTLKLEQQVLGLQYALAGKTGAASIVLTPAEVEDLIQRQPEPKTVADAVTIAENVFKTYNKRVAFSEQAYEAALDSPFLRPKDVLGSLIRLGFLWESIPPGARRAEQGRIALQCPLALHESESVVNNKRLMDERRVTTPTGETVHFQKHLKLGGGPQNDRTSLSIYFGDKDGEILIGIVGCHPTGARTQ